MKKISIILSTLGLLVFASCHKHSNSSNHGTLVLKFNPLFGDSALVLNQMYEAPDGKYYDFQHFKLYLSHLKLVYTNGNTVEVDSMIYFGVDDSADLSVTMAAPPGTYQGIQFNLGLDSLQDAMTPDISDTSSPIYINNGTYWSAQLQFVFVMIDGYGSTSPSLSNDFIFEYHVGTDPYYISGLQLSSPFVVNQGQQTTLTLSENVQNVFYGSPGAINILTDPATMTQGNTYDLQLAHTFINDFSQTFSLH